MVAGNTVVFKPATDTPWTSRLIAECFVEAGFPAGDGVFTIDRHGEAEPFHELGIVGGLLLAVGLVHRVRHLVEVEEA